MQRLSTGTEPCTPPGDSEYEVSLFGPGYGEGIVIHLGSGQWAMVDSCIAGRTKAPAGLAYLQRLGVRPEEAIRLVVATHWHDDHMAGISQVLAAATRAQFVCSDALRCKDLLTLVAVKRRLPASGLGTGVDEIRNVFDCLRQRGASPDLAREGQLLLRDPVRLWALSPSSEICLKFREAIAEELGQARFTQRVPVPPGPNEASVVLCMETPSHHVLLGADLEVGTHGSGWNCVLESTVRPSTRAAVFKVPHHGAESADHPTVWQTMLSPDPVALLTPWRLGGRELPTADDVRRISQHASRAYITARGVPRSPSRRDGAVERTIREVTLARRQALDTCGQIRVRWHAGTPDIEPVVSLFDGACSLGSLGGDTHQR